MNYIMTAMNIVGLSKKTRKRAKAHILKKPQAQSTTEISSIINSMAMALWYRRMETSIKVNSLMDRY